ncbi:hypothetical protein Tco_0084912 [Tanacetum coccineum]
MDFNFNNENEPWEFSLDIDDSDLYLTPVVRSSPQTLVRIIPDPAVLDKDSYVPQLSTPYAYDRCCAFKGSIQRNKSGGCGHGWKQSDCANCIWYKQRGNRHAAIALAVENEFPLAFHVPDAYKKLCDARPERWSRAHCPLVRYNYMTSNSVESINACSVIYRKEPMLKLAETYRAMVQQWYYERDNWLVLLHHYGRFTSPPGREFVGEIVAIVDPVKLDIFSPDQVKLILKNISNL